MDESEAPRFASVDSEGDVVMYPCPSCKLDNASFEWTATPTAEDFASYDDVFETDYRTFLGMITDEEDGNVRVFECDSCGQLIGYFSDTGSQYVA